MFKARSNRTRKKASKSSWLSGYVNNHQEVYSNPTYAPAKKKKSMRESSLAATVPAPPMPIPPPPMPAPASGKVKLSLAEYLELVEASEKSEWIRLDPPTPFIISEVRLAATATPGTNAVVFDMTVDIEVLTDFGKWAHIPLLPSRYPLLRSHVDCNAVSAFSEGSDPAYGATGLVGLNGSNYALVACTQGNYIVQLTFSAPYASIHKTGVKLTGLPRAAKSLCSFTVARRDVTIQVEPALEYTETFSNEGHRRVLAQYPPSTELSVSWTITEESEDEPDADLAAAGTPVGSIAPSTAAQVEKPAVVTVEHQHLFSVGEAVLSCRSSLNYTIIHSGVQVFEVALTDGCRVLAVDGGSVMQKWEVVDVAQLGREESSSDLDDGASDDGEGGSVRPRRERAASRKGKDAAPEGRVLRVQLTYPQEGSYSITVYSEKDMGREAGNVELPRFSSLRVARQKGFVGLLASTNVELEQVALAGRAVTKVDVKELPDKMSQLADHPILLGYKYLDPEFVLAVSVTKHQDVPVLVAVCDEMSVDITYTAEGKVLTEMKLDLRNNDRQYVRLDAGRDAEVWTTKVRERPVKCARDDSGLLMIPIPKSKESAFAASLIYKTDAEPMGHDGELEVVLPRVDVPVTRVKVTLYVPKLSEYEYDEPEGDLQTVQSFGYGNVQREVLSDQLYQQSYSVNANPMYDMAQVTNALYEEEKPRPRRAQSRNTTAGVIPVDVSAPKVGHALYFERLLLSQDEPQLHITLGYTEASNSRGWCC